MQRLSCLSFENKQKKKTVIDKKKKKNVKLRVRSVNVICQSRGSMPTRHKYIL